MPSTVWRECPTDTSPICRHRCVAILASSSAVILGDSETARQVRTPPASSNSPSKSFGGGPDWARVAVAPAVRASATRMTAPARGRRKRGMATGYGNLRCSCNFAAMLCGSAARRSFDRHVQVGHQAVAQGIDPAVDAERLAARPGVLDEDVRGDVGDLADDVELAQPLEPAALVADRLELGAVGGEDLADRVQPVVDQAPALAVARGCDPAAAIVADHQDVLDLDDVDRELQHRQVVGVLRRRQVGDVAVDEHLAGVEIADLVGGHAAVRAADPQILGRLLAEQALEEPGILLPPRGGPAAGCW